ncbi:C39 family peptidase [Lentzea flaviverrucosa]|uniref:Peptidase_C39 like family protein n=1 Tax=Lentzea flaviverrucosa TaxID=200379 RepID=A0A1H9KDG9_9PSEU|nr:C39 family peptidase [Lentzea flaviverrucosa]RDI17839.1 peptidase C39-like protein [Lentzea flaviverrucosa]SEQ97246.1 Peptidase_C39 like family protein [Lentzea flaviverrucosa]
MTKTSLALVVALGTLAAAVSPAQAVEPYSESPSQSHAVRSGGGYDVVVGGVKRATFDVSDPAFTIRSSSSADGALAAVISDFDGTSGSGLHTVDRYGKSRAVARGAITSAVFHGSVLAYADGENVVVDGVPVGKLKGRAPQLLGFTSDGTGLLAVQHPDVADDSTYVGSLVRFDLKTGAAKPLITSDATSLYRDFKLVDVKGERHVSFIKHNEIYRCGGADPQWLGLASEHGEVRSLVGETRHHYRSAVWSTDGARVAYEVMGCVSDKTLGTGQFDAFNGVYVHDLASRKASRVVEGLSFNYALTGFNGTEAVIGSPAKGYVKASGLRAASLDGEVTTMGRLNRAEYIHQLWDTRNEFNGNSSCGPTSAVIDLVTYQLPAEFGVQVSQPFSHYSKWGRYITDEFSNRGTTFNRTMNDWSRTGSWKGAHGWITGYYCGGNPARPCASWESERDFLARNGAAVQQGNFTPAQVRAFLDQGKFVIMSGTWGSTAGHLSVVIGYHDNGQFYVHDTYGAGTDGSYDGANQLYSWNYIAPVQMWAA